MIAGEELTHWLADPDRQMETAERIHAFGRRLRMEGPLAEFEQELSGLPAGDADSILAAASRFLEDGNRVDAPIAALIGEARSDPFFRPPLRRVHGPVHLGLLLLDCAALSLLVAVTTPDALAAKRLARRGPASITFGGQRSLFKFVKAGGAIISFWEAPAIDTGFTMAGSGRCRRVGRRRIADGELIPLDGRTQSFVIDHAESEMLFVQALTPAGAAPLSVEYDSDSLAFAAASSADEMASRIQMMTSLLRLMDRTDSAHLIERVLRHPHFHVRWHAMREFLALDADLALPALREMAAADPHPEVRAAAAQTLGLVLDDDLVPDMAEPCHA